MPSLTQDRTWPPGDIWQQNEANPSLPALSQSPPHHTYSFLSAWIHPPLSPRYKHTTGSPHHPQKQQAINCLRITHLGQAWPDPHRQQSKRATGSTKGAPLGMMRPSGSLMSSVQRRETRVTGGNWRRLSLMHMVVKGSWVRSSLGNVEQWVTRGQAVTPPLP